jgi:hypothetical protein
MQGVPLQIPEKVRRTAELLGEAGHVWLATLPQHIVRIERRWEIKVGQPFRNGTEALVAEARTSDGQDVVLKMVIPASIPRIKRFVYSVPLKAGVMRS